MPYFVLCVLVLLVASLSLRLRIRNMRRARCELERRRSLRSQLEASTLVDAIVSSYDTVSMRLVCDASPAIESIAKAQAAFDLYDTERAAWLRRASRLETSERSLGAIEKEHRQRVKR